MRTLIAAILFALVTQTQAPERPIVFWNVSVVDLDSGSIHSGMAVRTENHRITSVGPARAARPADARVIDGSGKFLLPGLWDSHVHLTKTGVPGLLMFVASGVTSVRDMGSDLAEVVQWRREIESEARLGPRIKTAGQILESRANVERMTVFLPYDVAVARLRADPLRRYLTRYLAADWAEQVEEKKGPDAAQGLQAYLDAAPGGFRDFREMHEAGVKFLAGSDAAVVFIHPGFSLHGELDSLVEDVGLTPVQALRAAIVNPAEFFGLERELGAVRPGYRADLVLLDRNPLDDIHNTRRIAGVALNGRWLDRQSLDSILDQAARAARLTRSGTVQ